MKESQLTSHLVGLRDSLASHLPGIENPAVAEMRRRAFARLVELGLPKIRDEAWRYTNIRTFEKTAFYPALEDSAKLSGQMLEALEIPNFDRYRIVLIDGWVNEELSMLDDLPNGVECVRLKTDFEGFASSDTLAALETRIAKAEHGFEVLSTAIAADGLKLRLKSGIKLDKPLEILHITQGNANAGLSNVNHFIQLEEGAKLDLLERYVSVAESQHMTSASVSIDLAEAAELNHYRVQAESSFALHIGYATSNQAPDSCYRIFSISLGALLDRHEVRQNLEGAKSHSEMKGLYIGRGRQHIDNYTTVVHASADASSDEYYKGILDDRSRSVFHGRIRVDQDAQHTDAQQQNRNLLLSTNAEATTKPQLEIYADDVKCSHGATVGYLESDAIFYLRSRGLDESEARTILTEAFAAEIVEKIGPAPLREHVLELVRDKLTNNHHLKEAA